LCSQEFMTWDELKTQLKPINDVLGGCLIICMSSCESFHACTMAMTLEENDKPFLALIANSSKPQWSDSAIAYATFYHLLAKISKIKEAVEAMKKASGDGNFVLVLGPKIKGDFINNYRKILEDKLAEIGNNLAKK
ncbi:MAG: hypothetical protein ABIJ26_03790, partial [Candidatus Margulisiibacteriota bacterium]